MGVISQGWRTTSIVDGSPKDGALAATLALTLLLTSLSCCCTAALPLILLVCVLLRRYALSLSP